RLADAVGAGKLEARARAHVAHVGRRRKTGIARTDDTATWVRCARRAGADVVGGIVVPGAVERRVVDDRAEGPVGGAAGIRPAREVEGVAHRPTTRGAKDERKPDACDGGRD